MTVDYNSFTRQLMEDIREHGRPSSGPMAGRPLMILTSPAPSPGRSAARSSPTPETATDTSSPQFWVDQERLVAVRMIVAFNPATPADVGDIWLMDYRPVSGGWLAVKVEINHGGQIVQKEEYRDWRGNVDLPRDFFVAEKWSAVPHWHR